MANSDEVAEEADGRVADVIERLGVGPSLVKEVIVGAGVWLVSGSSFMVLSAVTWVMSHEWELRGWHRSSIVSVVFIGKLVGNVLGGPFSDTFGRRWPIVLSYAVVLVFSIVAALSPGFWTICAARIILGMAFGVAQSTWTALCSEVTPASWRMVVFVASNILFVLGEVLGGVLLWLSDPQLKRMDWRWLTIMAALPALVLGLGALVSLNESASWLAVQGQTSRAKEVLLSIRWWNRKEQVPVDFKVAPVVASQSGLDSVRVQSDVAFGPTLRYSTMVLCFSCFTLNFVYYGGFYSFPLVLGDVVDMGVSPAMALVVGVAWEVPGYCIAPFSEKAGIGRRWSIVCYLALMTCSIMMFVKAAENEANGAMFLTMLHLGYAGMKCWVNFGFCFVYQYIAELYPTSARAAGTGLCIGCGRFGSIVVPFVFEAMAGMFTNAWAPFFYTMACCCIINAALVFMLPFETYGMTLKDRIDDMSESEPLVSSCAAPRKM